MSDPLVRWCIYVALGGLLTLMIVLMPRQLKLLAGRFLPPNWASVLHVPIAWIGYFALILNGQYLAGILMMALSGGLDKLDGMSARAHDELDGRRLVSLRFWDQMSHPGTTPLGKSLDPLADKVTVFPIFAHMGAVFVFLAAKSDWDHAVYLVYTGAGMILLMLIIDAAGQLVRLDRFEAWRATEDKSATRIGKIKSAAQWFWLPFFPVWQHGWITEPEVYLLLLDFLLAIVLALTLMSALSKFKRPCQKKSCVGRLIQE